MKTDDRIQYWAHMLDELNERGGAAKIDERGGQDGHSPIAHPRTRNRADVPVQYMVMVDAESPDINDWHTKFAMQNLQLTSSVRDSDEAKAFKTTVPERAEEFADRVIRKYPRSYVILCKNEHSYAPVRRQNCKRFGVVDIYEPGFGWRNGGPTLSERSLDERKMVGPAGAAKGQNGGVDEIADFRQKLQNGVIHFKFTKVDNQPRTAVGTTSEQVFPTAERRKLDPEYDEKLESYMRRQAFIIWFWDLEKNSLRCFNTNRFDGIIRFEPTDKRVDANVERVGNIFIHRDVDPGMEANAPLDGDRANDINMEIGHMMMDHEPEIVQIFGGLDIRDVPNAEIELGPQGEPVLRIEIRRRGNENDRPYELRINELRGLIRERWNVDVKKVVVDGEFTF